MTRLILNTVVFLSLLSRNTRTNSVDSDLTGHTEEQSHEGIRAVVRVSTVYHFSIFATVRPMFYNLCYSNNILSVS